MRDPDAEHGGAPGRIGTEDMLCTRCRDRLPDPRGDGGALSDLPAADRLAQVLCTRCTALLPPVDETEGLLRRLSRLARFGLAGGTLPLLGG